MTDHEMLELLVQQTQVTNDHFAQIDNRFTQIDDNFAQIDNRFTQIDSQLHELQKTTGELQKTTGELQKTTGELQSRIIKIEITQENLVLPQLQVTAEGVVSIHDKLIPRREFDEMKDELSFLKDIVRMHTAQLNELKNAI